MRMYVDNFVALPASVKDIADLRGPSAALPGFGKMSAGNAQRFREVRQIDPVLLRHVLDPAMVFVILPQAILLHAVRTVATFDAVRRDRPLTTLPERPT